MYERNHTEKDEGNGAVDRRTFLRTAGVAGSGLAATALGTGAGAAASNGPKNGFPPAGITEWSDPVRLGNGELRTFTSATPSGEPTCHGVYLDRSALSGLPGAEELSERGESDDPGDKYGPTGEAIEIHGAWSQEFFVPFPATAATPVTFLGLTWNPAGHPPPGIYDVPHFDVHFHFLEMEMVDAIEGLAPAGYALPGERIPEGYVRLPEPAFEDNGGDDQFAVVTDMGEHLADPTSPELAGEGEFTNTLIWGAYDPDDDGEGELTFVEPMLTKAYLEGISGTNRYEIGQPETYARPGAYPTEYAVRDVPNEDAIAITIESFESVDG